MHQLKDRIKGPIIAVAIVVTIILTIIYHVFIVSQYWQLKTNICKIFSIPTEFTDTICEYTSFTNASYAISVHNACDGKNITVSNINEQYSSMFVFPCYFNTTYCWSNDTVNSINTRFYKGLTDYNACETKRQTGIDMLEQSWVTMAIVVPIVTFALSNLLLHMMVLVCCNNGVSGDNKLKVSVIDLGGDTDLEVDTASTDETFISCSMCDKELIVSRSLLLECCNVSVHRRCFINRRTVDNINCVNKKCSKRHLEIYYKTHYEFDNPCKICMNSMTDQSTLLKTGCCDVTVHQWCYYLDNSYMKWCNMCTKKS